MFSMRAVTSALLAVTACAFVAPALAQTTAEDFIYYPHGPDEYYFFEQTDRKEVADFKTDHLVRVCVDQNRHMVPLDVIHDGETTVVRPGDCARVDAMEVSLEPAKRLEPRWTIRAEVDTS